MNEHFTITLHDDNGVKQFNLHKFVKKALLFGLSFLGFIGLSAIGTILYLKSSVEQIEQQRVEMESANKSLKLQNELLDENIKNTQYALSVKKEELLEVSDSLSEIETLIGLSTQTEVPLKERANITKLDSEQRATLLQLIPSGSPVPYKGVTSKFGYRVHPTLNRKEFHRGTDLRAALNTPVYATADGVVEYSGYHKKSGFGNLVILHHSHGFKTYYGHLNKVVLKSGAFVKKGDLIAYTGNTGMSSGPHLHYEVRFISRFLNPFWFIKWNMKNYNEIFEKEKKIPWQSLITATTHIKVQKPTQIPQSLPQDQ